MLELKTKWFTNSLAKQSMLNKDFVACIDSKRLYVVGYGIITRSGKNTYNVVLKDSNDKVLEEYTNLYLDAITKLIIGNSPKSKASKDANESKDNESKPKNKASKQGNKDTFLLTFDNAFEIACKKIESCKDIAKVLGKYDTKDACILALHLIKEANESEKQRIKDAKKHANIEALKRTLEIAIESQNEAMIEQIKRMIAIEESM